MMIAMNRETLLAELDRLFDAGEPLFSVFPKQHPEGYPLQLPDSISPEMKWYANEAALRAWNREQINPNYRLPSHATKLARVAEDYEVALLGWIAICKVGLSGWRAIGVLKSVGPCVSGLQGSGKMLGSVVH